MLAIFKIKSKWNTYPVTVVFNNNILVGVKIVLVFIVFVSLPNKTCSGDNAPNYQKDEEARKCLKEDGPFQFRITYPTMADHLGDFVRQAKEERYVQRMSEPEVVK